MEFCNKIIPTRSQYAEVAEHKCHCPKGHHGKCEEFPFLNHLKSINKQVAEKIKRDATMTTGAAWKSADAGPNRILRWVMLLDDEELLKYGINMRELKPGVIAKLREKVQIMIPVCWLPQSSHGLFIKWKMLPKLLTPSKTILRIFLVKWFPIQHVVLFADCLWTMSCFRWLPEVKQPSKPATRILACTIQTM